MKSVNQVVNGVQQFLNEEILPHLSGAKRYGATVYLSLISQNASENVKNLLSKPAVMMIGISDGENVDVDKLHAAMIKAMQEEKLALDIPLIGTFSFTRMDIDKLFEIIGRQL